MPGDLVRALRGALLSLQRQRSPLSRSHLQVVTSRGRRLELQLKPYTPVDEFVSGVGASDPPVAVQVGLSLLSPDEQYAHHDSIVRLAGKSFVTAATGTFRSGRGGKRLWSKTVDLRGPTDDLRGLECDVRITICLLRLLRDARDSRACALASGTPLPPDLCDRVVREALGLHQGPLNPA
jgi:hypothetical protein